MNLKDKITRNRLKDAFIELENILQDDKEERNRLATLKAKLSKSERNHALGLITMQEHETVHSSTVFALLNIVDEIEERKRVKDSEIKQSVSEKDLTELKKKLKNAIDELRFDEVFEMIEDFEQQLQYDRSILSNLKIEFLEKGRTDSVYCAQFKLFVNSMRSY